MAQRKRKRKPDYGKRVVKNDFPKMYPTIYCVAEQLYIGISNIPLKSKVRTIKDINGNFSKTVDYKKKMLPEHFHDWRIKWRSEEYRIDMSKFNDGDEVLCPKCKCKVDFRAFPSSTVPEFIERKENEENKTDQSNQLSETQKADGDSG